MKRLTLSTILPDWNSSLRTTVLFAALILASAPTAMADSQKLASQVEETVVKQAPQQTVANAASPDSFQLNRFSINAAGAIDDSSASYRLGLSLGEPVVGTASSASYQMGTGFWYEPSLLKRGDANGDGIIDAADVVYLLNYLYRNDPPPDPYEAGDCNCDGEVTAGDVVYLINYLFRGWPPPSC
jgi:hypothetical protein